MSNPCAAAKTEIFLFVSPAKLREWADEMERIWAELRMGDSMLNDSIQVNNEIGLSARGRR